MAQLTLDLDDSLRFEVIRALNNHAAYMRGYRSNGTIAKQLEDLAAEIQAPVDAPAKNPVTSETTSTKKKRSA